MWSIVFMGALWTTALDVNVQTLRGESVHGALVELNADQLVVDTSDGSQRLALDALVAVEPAKHARATGPQPTLVVQLVDDSTLAATGFTVRNAVATIVLSGDRQVDVPTRLIRQVRFRAGATHDEKLEGQWSEIVKTKAAADLLVVRKGDALDFLEGVLGDIGKDKVRFELDGEPAGVSLGKVEAVVYYHATSPKLPEPVCQATDAYGTRLMLSAVRLVDEDLQCTTAAGLEFRLPLASLARLDLSSGKIVYLSDLEPESVKYTPYFGLADELPALTALYQPRRDVGFDQNPLQLDGTQYHKGIALHSRTEVDYRLPGKFRRLQTRIGIDDNTRGAGQVHVSLDADGHALWQGDLRGGEPSRELDLELKGARRLKITVDFGRDLDIGDDVDLCEARVTK